MGNNTAMQFSQEEVTTLLWVLERLLKKEKLAIDAKKLKQLEYSSGKLTRYLYEMTSKGLWNAPNKE